MSLIFSEIDKLEMERDELRAEVARLREALRPFCWRDEATEEDYDRARAALEAALSGGPQYEEIDE